MTVNFLSLSSAVKPLLSTRRRGARMEVRCPCCSAWRPGFCIAPMTPEAAAALGHDWGCDGCSSKVSRSAEIAAEPITADDWQRWILDQFARPEVAAAFSLGDVTDEDKAALRAAVAWKASQ
jgi:hypothetical protein